MTVRNEEIIKKISDSIDEMALVGYRLDKLLEGFKYYNDNKNTLDIDHYEMALDMFVKAIDAMEEHMNRFHRLFMDLQTVLKEV